MNIVVFWSVAGAMTALVLMLLSWPLLRRRGRAPGTSNQVLNASIYRGQLVELDRDHGSGALSEADYREARAELERRLLDDIRGDAGPAATVHGGQRAIRTALALLLAVPLAAVSLYLLLGNPQALVGATAQSGGAAHEAGAAASAAELNRLADSLAAKLEKNPDNPQGWIMLGRTYKILARHDEADRAYQRAGSAANAQPALMLERVELAADRNNGQIEGEALAMLKRVLDMEPANPQAMFLAGLGALNRQDYRAAIDYWSRLSKQAPPGSQEERALAAGIAEARARLRGKER